MPSNGEEQCLNKNKIKLKKEITDFCLTQRIPAPAFQWNYIPFSGEWGISISLFKTAAFENQRGENRNVAERAQQLALMIAEGITLPVGFSKIEAVKGYLNLYFSTSAFARRVLDSILEEKGNFGRHPARNEQIMVEFSNQIHTRRSMWVTCEARFLAMLSAGC